MDLKESNFLTQLKNSSLAKSLLKGIYFLQY